MINQFSIIDRGILYFDYCFFSSNKIPRISRDLITFITYIISLLVSVILEPITDKSFLLRILYLVSKRDFRMPFPDLRYFSRFLFLKISPLQVEFNTNPPTYTIFKIRDFDNFILIDELLEKALQNLEIRLSVKNDLCGKLVSSLESSIIW